jgi:UDP-N-acetyl-2-amino-2-deoxyglucuronate dehydrogenase
MGNLVLQPPVNFALLGAGMVANYHRQAVLANADRGARLIAIGHYNPARFESISEAFGVPCRSYDDLLADQQVHAICICTPNGQHAQQAIAAARAGKHVLVEKPIALTLADADTMIAAAAQANVRLGVVLQRRSDPLFQRVAAAIRAGDLGRLTLGAINLPYLRPQAYFEQAEWRGTWAIDGGGALMNQGIHLVDLLVWFMGDPVEVQAYGATLARNIEVEDTLSAALRFENGALATITATTTAVPGFPHRIEIYGTEGGIQIEGESIARWQAKNAPEIAQPATPAVAGAGSDPRGISPSGHIAIVRNFIDAVREQRSPEIDGAEGRRSLAAVLAVYRAAGLIH